MKLKTIVAASAVFMLILASNTLAQTNTPSLKVVTPSEGQTVYSQRIPVLLATENFQLVDYQQYKTTARGQGHIHLWLDESSPTADSAKQISTESFTYSDVPYGEHTLRAELVSSNHTSLNPPVTTTVKFKSAPITTPSPAPVSGFDKNTALVILVVVALVIVAAWWYTKEEEEPPTKSKAESQSRKSKRETSKRRKK